MVRLLHAICAFWLSVKLGPVIPVSIALIDSDEYDYLYGTNPSFMENENGDFSGEEGSGELDSFSDESVGTRNSLNIREPEMVTHKDEIYRSYLDVINRLNKTMNLRADPCNDFYDYACGKSKRVNDVFSEMEEQNDLKIINVIDKFEYSTTEDSFVNKVKNYYESCIASCFYDCKNLEGIKSFQQVIHHFSTTTGLHFPWSIGENSTNQTLNPKTLATALATLSSLFVDTFITPSMIHYDVFRRPQYMLFIDQSTLYHSITTYNKTSTKELKNYKMDIIDTLKKSCIILNINIKDDKIEQIAEDIINLEITLAKEYSAEEALDGVCYSTTECYVENFEDYGFIDFEEYFRILSENSKYIRDYFANGNHSVLGRKYILQKLNNDFNSKFRPDVVVNYLFYRLLISRRGYFQFFTKKECAKMTEHGTSNRCQNCTQSRKQHPDDAALLMLSKWKCLQQIKTDIPEAADRFDLTNIDEEERYYLEAYLNELMNNVRYSLIHMLRHTFNNDDDSFTVIRKELAQVAIVVRYPTYINDSYLNSRYSDLKFEETDTFLDMHEKLLQFRFATNYELLANRNTTKFGRLINADDVRYDFLERKISVAFTLLAKPFFDYDWPTSIIYGTLGSVIGHELIHSFADMQHRYEGFGKTYAKTLLKMQSSMEKCLIKHYQQYCPLNGTGIKPECLDGYSSLAENMADNAGMVAAYLAYRDQISFHGRDPQLPHPKFGKLTHDQLFFLGYAHNFCRKPLKNDEWVAALVSSPQYSPRKYRVIGTTSNFAAFQNAFNCPLPKEDDLSNRCYVWLPKPDDNA